MPSIYEIRDVKYQHSDIYVYKGSCKIMTLLKLNMPNSSSSPTGYIWVNVSVLNFQNDITDFEFFLCMLMFERYYRNKEIIGSYLGTNTEINWGETKLHVGWSFISWTFATVFQGWFLNDLMIELRHFIPFHFAIFCAILKSYDQITLASTIFRCFQTICIWNCYLKI